MFSDLETTVKKLDKDVGEVEERVMDGAKSNEPLLNKSISAMETSFRTQMWNMQLQNRIREGFESTHKEKAWKFAR